MSQQPLLPSLPFQQPTSQRYKITAQQRPLLFERGLAVRPITPDDEALLYTLYATSRAEELALTDWDESAKADFLRMQFRAQHIHYHKTFEQPDFLIILFHKQPIGRIYIDYRPQELSLAEITLLPEYRNQGIGSAFIQDLMTEASELEQPLRLHVEHFNPAKRLYNRLGFSCLEDNGVYLHLEWCSKQMALSQSA